MPTEAELQAARAAGYLTPSGQQLIRDGDDAISNNAVASNKAATAVRWYHGRLPNPAPVATLRPGVYDVSTYAESHRIDPPLPAEWRGSGTLVVYPGTTSRTVEWSPIGTTIRPKPIIRNEYNSGLTPPWYGWRRVDADALRPPELNTDLITVFGDSQSEAAVVGSWDEYAGPLIEQALYNQARSGDDTVAIGIRAGWVQPLVTVSGGVIPASGSVTLHSDEQITTRENRVLIGATVAGVGGSLRYDTAGQFTFTRSTAGDPVTVAGPVRVVSAFSTSASVILVWMGGNDFNGGYMGSASTIADHVIAGYQQAVAWGAEKGQAVVVAGVTNRLSDGPGTPAFAEVQDINRRLRENHPAQFLDVQGYYSEHAIYDAGLTPTQADLDAMAQGAIPPQLFLADGVHLTTAAHEAMGAHRIAPWLVARGYATPATAVPPPASITRETTEQRLARIEAQLSALV